MTLQQISHISWGVGGKYFTQNTDYLGLSTKLAAVAGPGVVALCVATPAPTSTLCSLTFVLSPCYNLNREVGGWRGFKGFGNSWV